MTDINPENYMTNGLGHLVPINRVKDIDKLRDQLVRELVTEAIKLQETLIEFKRKAYSDIAAFTELSANDYGKTWGGKKGNLKLPSYDHNLMIQIQISELMSCDERLEIAKKTIDECLSRWTEGGREEIRTVINAAFAVNQEGKVNVRRLLALRSLDIKDPDWLKAMDMISDSLQVSGSKSYLRVYKRTEPEGKYINIPLDFAAL